MTHHTVPARPGPAQSPLPLMCPPSIQWSRPEGEAIPPPTPWRDANLPSLLLKIILPHLTTRQTRFRPACPSCLTLQREACTCSSTRTTSRWENEDPLRAAQNVVYKAWLYHGYYLVKELHEPPLTEANKYCNLHSVIILRLNILQDSNQTTRNARNLYPDYSLRQRHRGHFQEGFLTSQCSWTSPLVCYFKALNLILRLIFTQVL